jgi:hypothetical protein
MDFNTIKRVTLIKILRANQKQPADVLKHSKAELVAICEKFTDLDLSCLSDVKVKPDKVKPDKVKPVKSKKTIEPVPVPKVVLNELSDSSSDDDEPTPQPVPKTSRLLQRKKLTTQPPPIQTPTPPPPPVKQPKQEKKSHENDVKEILKIYTNSVRQLLLDFEQGLLDQFDIKHITDEYNDLRELAENQIDQIIAGLDVDFSPKFYETISKILDNSFNKVEQFLM